MNNLITQYQNILPEVFLTLSNVIILLFGSLQKKFANKKVKHLSILSLVITIIIILFTGDNESYEFYKMLHITKITQVIKFIILLLSTIVLMISFPYLDYEKINLFEYPILIIFALIGMMIMISANDLIIVFLSTAITNIALYVLITIKKNNANSSAAGIKYFVLSIFTSALFLFGSSYLYGFCGSTEFQALSLVFNQLSNIPTYIIIALSMIFISFAFKLALVPFHVWMPDVYDGSPTPVTLFIATIPKISGFILLINFINYIVIDYYLFWQVIYILSALTMIVGAFMGLFQTKIKRLIAYSTITHIGFVFLGLLGNTSGWNYNIISYLLIYAISNIVLFSMLLSIQNAQGISHINELSGLSKYHSRTALYISLMLFSLIGIPPFAGFFTKLIILKDIILKQHYFLAILAVICNVISAAYYLKIIKLMYFNDPKEENNITTVTMSKINKFIINILTIIITFSAFILYFIN